MTRKRSEYVTNSWQHVGAKPWMTVSSVSHVRRHCHVVRVAVSNSLPFAAGREGGTST